MLQSIFLSFVVIFTVFNFQVNSASINEIWTCSGFKGLPSVQGTLISNQLSADYKNAITIENTLEITNILSTLSGIATICEIAVDSEYNKKLWTVAITKNDYNLLFKLKSIGVEMRLSNDELVNFIKSFKSISYYKTIEFLMYYIKLNDDIAITLLAYILSVLTTPTTKEQQNSQLMIIKKLIEYPKPKKALNSNFYYVMFTMNIPVVDFVIKEFDIKVNDLFEVGDGDDGAYIKMTILQVVVDYLIYNPNINNKMAYEMIKHLVFIGADTKKRDFNGNDVNFSINQIKDENIKNKLNEIINKLFPVI